MTKYLEKGWTIFKKIFEKASIAFGAYTVGDSNNDVDKITKVLTKINTVHTHKNTNKKRNIKRIISRTAKIGNIQIISNYK